MNTILVPTDFSPAADNAMNYALDLAAREDSKIILLHVVPERILKESNGADVKSAEEKLMSLHTQVLESKKIGCDRILLRGDPEKEILRLAEARKPSLIAIGMRGAGEGLQRIIGRTARKIIEKARCPVIAVPEGSYFKEISKITYATNYHESDIDALKILTEIAKTFNARIILLHISDKKQTPDAEAALMKEFCNKIREKTGYENFSYQVLPGKNIEKELEEYSGRNSTDLLVMSTHHRDIIDKIFGKSLTKKITFHTSVPLFVFHHKEKPVIFIFGLAIMKS